MDSSVLPYRRIYFDTNAFISSHWPSISAAFSNVTISAKAFEIPCVLLEPVEAELVNHWLEETADASRVLERQVKSLAARLDDAGIRQSLRLPKQEDIEKAFLSKHEQAVREVKLTRASPRYRKAKELFSMAVSKVRPFEAKGKNFQDVVILLAVIDDMRRTSTAEAAFVSNDGVFSAEVLDEVCKPSKLKLHLFKTIDALWTDVLNYANQSMRQVYEFAEAIAKKEVLDNLAKIKTFLDDNLEIPATVGAFARRPITRITRIELTGVRRVVSPVSPADTEEDSEPVRDENLTAYLDVTIYAIARAVRTVPRDAITLKVGQSRPPVVYQGSPIFVEQEEILNRVVAVELERHVDAMGQAHITPISASLTTQADSNDNSSLRIIPGL